ncbi:MAG: hypothetical protein Q9222_007595, partial [Ikaeria aurantiellina]
GWKLVCGLGSANGLIFTSTSPDTVAHTASSRAFVTVPDLHDAIGLETDEQASAAYKTADMIKQFGNDGEPANTAYRLHYGLPIWENLRQHPERARRFGAAMRFFTKGEGMDLQHLVAGYDWKSIDTPGSTVVDVGGGHGSVSQALARATSHIYFVVQDQPDTVAQARKELPTDLETRVEFQEHDFFTPQPLRGKQVYLMRWILHDWSDGYCVRLLRNLVPALEDHPDSRIMVYEFLMPDKPVTKLSESFGV